MKLIEGLIKTNRRIFLLIFFVALFTNIVISLTTENKYIYPDSHTYHVLAVNLAEGNGYSTNISEPFQPNFTRDPAYPFFMSLVYRVYSQFNELTIVPFNSIDLDENGRLLFVPGEMIWVKIFQILLAAVSCVFFYLILLYVFNQKYALIITILFALYFPYFYHDFNILRESFQSSIAIITNYFFISFIKRKKLHFIILFGVFWGILNLTLQISLLIGFFFPIILILNTKSIKRTIIATFFGTLSMLIIISPYIIRSYNYYPNIRVIKSMGCSITLEKKNYYGTFIKLRNLEYITEHEFDSLKNDLWSLSENQTFEKSFNDEFKMMTNNLRLRHPIPKNINNRYIFQNNIKYAAKTWFKNIYKNPSVSFSKSLKEHDFITVIPQLFSILFGLFAFAGFIVYFRYTYSILLIFLSIVTIYFIIGDEARRALPAHPYIFMFGVLMTITLFYLLHNNSLHDIKKRVFMAEKH